MEAENSFLLFEIPNTSLKEIKLIKIKMSLIKKIIPFVLIKAWLIKSITRDYFKIF